ncbi:MAG: hypothetical protein QOD83_2680 [Solirubrobacteraceae bacterium]|nr:hypothetical protein [Solirubrobacteraceae bacterium]
MNCWPFCRCYSDDPTSATDLPPTMYGGWLLRGDQADRLSKVVGEDAPERCAPGRAVMLVEVRTPGGAASVWVNADGTAIHERLHERGRELLASLGVNAHRAPYLVADVRDLDQHGRPPERNAVCRCGSARKAKNCVHRGPPGFFSTGWLFLHQAEWDRFLAREDDFWRPDIPMMAPSHAYRRASSHPRQQVFGDADKRLCSRSSALPALDPPHRDGIEPECARRRPVAVSPRRQDLADRDAPGPRTVRVRRP